MITIGSCVKSRPILHVFDPNFFRGIAPEFLDIHYKVYPDNVVKFHGSRLTQLADLAAN